MNDRKSAISRKEEVHAALNRLLDLLADRIAKQLLTEQSQGTGSGVGICGPTAAARKSNLLNG
jgi:hypothetical protein